MSTKLDLNSDLGEGESAARTRALMRWITSANVACGGHAGGVRSMENCVRLAKEFQVRLGAHPGPWSRENHGRIHVSMTPAELELLLLQQVGALERVARRHGVPLHHLKLHGWLYHATEHSDALARSYVQSAVRWWPGVKIFALSGGRVARIAMQIGVPVWEEIFADRGYRHDGALIDRSEPQALITQPRLAAERVRTFLATGQIHATSGQALPLRAQTICIHADTPGAAAMAQAVRKLLDD